MGGNRFIRTEYTDDQVLELFERYKSQENKQVSLFSGKDKKTIKLWIYDLAIHMSRSSKAKLQHLINIHNNEVPECSACQNEVTIIDIDESSNTYKKYCSGCTQNYAWATKEIIGEDALAARGKLISTEKKKWYQTSDGKEFAERIGQHNSVKMKEFHASEEGTLIREKNAAMASILMREKIAKGEFTPHITNSRTHWTAEIILDGLVTKFRSSWEACFWLSNMHLSYETYRIPYSLDGIDRTYIADFYDYETNTLYEIKPSGRWVKESDKMQKVVDFCQQNNVKFIWINEKNIMKYIDKTKFNEDNISQYNMLLKGI